MLDVLQGDVLLPRVCHLPALVLRIVRGWATLGGDPPTSSVSESGSAVEDGVGMQG